MGCDEALPTPPVFPPTRGLGFYPEKSIPGLRVNILISQPHQRAVCLATNRHLPLEETRAVTCILAANTHTDTHPSPSIGCGAKHGHRWCMIPCDNVEIQSGRFKLCVNPSAIAVAAAPSLRRALNIKIVLSPII